MGFPACFKQIGRGAKRSFSFSFERFFGYESHDAASGAVFVA